MNFVVAESGPANPETLNLMDSIRRENCLYTSAYCEENAYKLCERILATSPDKANASCRVIFVSNDAKSVPIWRQRASKEENGLVVWDYHVFVLDLDLVYDLDTTLTFPVKAVEYLEDALRDENSFFPRFKRKFRLIEAEEFLEKFASDRSHMLKPDKTGYLKPVPDYPPIQTSESSNNLQEFISMDEDKVGFGSVLDFEAFKKKILQL